LKKDEFAGLCDASMPGWLWKSCAHEGDVELARS
jgi:hypothetical protein